MVKVITREQFLSLWEAGVRSMWASAIGNEWAYFRQGKAMAATEGDFLAAKSPDVERGYRFLVEVE